MEDLRLPNVQKFIRDHEHDDVQQIALSGNVIDGVSAAQLATQISGRRKARRKFPLLYNTADIVYPPSVNLEQASSEATASYKAALLSGLPGLEGGDARGVDLTGGFGIDSFFLAKQFSQFHYVEPDAELLPIVAHNHRQLGANNIQYHASTAGDFLRQLAHPVGFVMIDPSRRGEGKRSFRLSDASPDIVSLQHEILAKARWLLLKASPFLDISKALAELPFTRRVVVLAVENEMKELLFLSEQGFSGRSEIEAVNLLSDGASETYKMDRDMEASSNPVYADPGRYLYEPNAAILKAGAFKSIASAFGLRKVHPNTHLYTDSTLRADFPGRVFLVEHLVKPDRKMLRIHFPDGKANVVVRNYPLQPDALKMKAGINDGGEKFLLAFSGMTKKFVAVASRLK